MNLSQDFLINPEKNFTVHKKDTNNSKALLSNVLYNEMEQFVATIITNHKDLVYPTPQLFKLQILKNAYLNDKLILNAQIKKLEALELHLSVLVKQKNKPKNNIICKAIFKFQLKEEISIAS